MSDILTDSTKNTNPQEEKNTINYCRKCGNQSTTPLLGEICRSCFITINQNNYQQSTKQQQKPKEQQTITDISTNQNNHQQALEKQPEKNRNNNQIVLCSTCETPLTVKFWKDKGICQDCWKNQHIENAENTTVTKPKITKDLPKPRPKNNASNKRRKQSYINQSLKYFFPSFFANQYGLNESDIGYQQIIHNIPREFKKHHISLIMYLTTIAVNNKENDSNDWIELVWRRIIKKSFFCYDTRTIHLFKVALEDLTYTATKILRKSTDESEEIRERVVFQGRMIERCGQFFRLTPEFYDAVVRKNNAVPLEASQIEKCHKSDSKILTYIWQKFRSYQLRSKTTKEIKLSNEIIKKNGGFVILELYRKQLYSLKRKYRNFISTISKNQCYLGLVGNTLVLRSSQRLQC